MFSIITIASSTMKPTEIVSAISEMLSRLKPADIHDREGGEQRQRHRHARDHGRPNRAQEQEDDEITRVIVSSIVNCTSRTAARVTSERSSIRSTWTDGGIDCSSFGISALIVSTSAIVLAPGAFWIAMPSAALVVEPGADTRVLHRIDGVADVLDADRRAVADRRR